LLMSSVSVATIFHIRNGHDDIIMFIAIMTC
jgi:hypothetical protein